MGSAQGLSRLLADTCVLYLKTRNFRWNVEGPMFQTLTQRMQVHEKNAWMLRSLLKK
jgi:starvation-inducible DNA-binding protein